MADNKSPVMGTSMIKPANELSSMDALAQSIVDDVLQNIIHDLVLQTHREEKMERARSAAVLVEQKAMEMHPEWRHPESSNGFAQTKGRVEIPGAVYEDGRVYLKGNPLATTSDIRCARCGLPRLLHPTDGNGARKTESVQDYCKRHPFIDKPGHDIYGHLFPVEGPGKGHKKKKEIPLAASQDSVGTNGSADGEVKPAATFPNVKCHVCQRSLNVRRFAKHLEQCLGIRSRASGRAAMLKMNGTAATSANGSSTPPSSQRSTPLPGTKRSSPSKREAEELDDDGESDDSTAPQKKKLKKTMLKLKAPKMGRSSSQLSFEQKREGSIESNHGTVTPKKKAAVVTKKWKSGRQTIDGKTKVPPTSSIPDKPLSSIHGKTKKGIGGGSDSSHTLSSP